MSAAEIATALSNARREGRIWRCRWPLHDGCTPVPASEAERPLEPGAQPLKAGRDRHDIPSNKRSGRMTNSLPPVPLALMPPKPRPASAGCSPPRWPLEHVEYDASGTRPHP